MKTIYKVMFQEVNLGEDEVDKCIDDMLSYGADDHDIYYPHYDLDDLIADCVDDNAVEIYYADTFGEAEMFMSEVIIGKLDDEEPIRIGLPDGREYVKYRIAWIEELELNKYGDVEMSSMYNIYTNVTKYQDVKKLDSII